MSSGHREEVRLPLTGHLRLLSAYLLPQRGRLILLAALILAEIALRLINPQIIRIFIDTAEAGGPFSALTSAGLLYLLVGLLGRGVNLGAAYAGLNLGWTATNRLRTDLAAHLLRLDMPFHKAHTPGELIERVDGDVTTLAEFFADLSIKFTGNALLVVAILVLLGRESAGAGALLAGYTIVVFAALLLVARLGVRAWDLARQAWADQMGFLEERFGATEDLRGIGAEAHALAQLSRLMLNLLRKARAGWMANALGYATTNFLFILGYGLGLATGALLYLRGDVTIGAAFMIVYYIGMLSAPLEEIRGQMEQLQQATASVNRVSELFSLAPAVRDTGSTSLPAGPLSVEFERVHFRYDDNAGANGRGQPASFGNGGSPGDGEANPSEPGVTPGAVVTDVSFQLPPGRVLGVLGRTGSGKTTTTRLLCRLYDPQAGTIRLGGCDLREIPLAELRRAVGLVTQDVQLFGATVSENIALFDAQTPESAIRQALGELGLLDWVLQMPQGLDTKLAGGGGGMSAGEAQLLAFARILLRDPGLVILDEATSRLDPVTERRLERAIDRLLHGGKPRTAIIIAHRLHTLQRADDILILHEGRVIEFGPRTALAADPDSRFSQLLRTGLEEVLA